MHEVGSFRALKQVDQALSRFEPLRMKSFHVAEEDSEPGRSRGERQNRALRKLHQLDAAATVEDLRNPPGNRLEVLKGDRVGQMSIRINDQCFRWFKGDAQDVEVVDYHS